MPHVTIPYTFVSVYYAIFSNISCVFKGKRYRSLLSLSLPSVGRLVWVPGES